MSNNLITVDALDFDGIKNNIKTFLSGQDVLKDWAYEGQVISTLIDVLAYNTHYNALYTNLMLNESFIDSASKYQSVVSLAKQIGYVAKSYRSARAQILLVVSDMVQPTQTLTLPKNTKFGGQLNGNDYFFYQSAAVTAKRTQTNTYEFIIDLVEGVPSTNAYTVGTENAANKFVIQNKNVDLSTLSVQVQQNRQSSILTQFNRAEELLDVRNSDNVYFINQREDLLYEVSFGNDIIGKALSPGNIVYLDYKVSSGAIANNASQFYYVDGFRGDVLYRVVTISNAIGGADRETIESIKLNAPRAYTAQNRAVTASDYKTAILSEFPQVQSIAVWGGEDNTPKKYGTVFISGKPYNRLKFSTQEKTEMQSYLSRYKSMMTVNHEFVDPVVVYISVSTDVYYDQSRTIYDRGTLETMVRSTIENYAATLGDYTKSFRFQALQRLIDSTNAQIVNNNTRVKLTRTETPMFGISQVYMIDTGNPISSEDVSVISSRFYSQYSTLPCYVSQDKYGRLNLYELRIDTTSRLLRSIGTVDFESGKIITDGILINALYDIDFRFTITTKSNDIIAFKNHILEIPSSEISVNMIVEAASKDHVFTYSR